MSGSNCRFKIFADDVKLYLNHENILPSTDDVSVLQTDIDLLVATGAALGLKVNTYNCVVLRFCPKSSNPTVPIDSPYKVNGCNIKFVQSHSVLGVLVDPDLKFHVHVRRVAAVAAGLTANLLGCTLCRDSDFLMNLYVSHVRPKLEYGSQLWNVDYVGDMKLLERIQRKWFLPRG